MCKRLCYGNRETLSVTTPLHITVDISLLSHHFFFLHLAHQFKAKVIFSHHTIARAALFYTIRMQIRNYGLINCSFHIKNKYEKEKVWRTLLRQFKIFSLPLLRRYR